MAAPSIPSVIRNTINLAPTNQTKVMQVVTEVTTFTQSDVNRAFLIWEASEAKRLTARKAYDDAVITGLEIAYSSQIVFNATQAAATNARTDYYALVSAYKKQLRERAKA